MITDVPSMSDFEVSGIEFLNLAWDAVINLLLNIDYSGLNEWDDDGSISDEYWASAQKPLSVALALVQQGTELLLKGRIAKVSPFLLISGDPRVWPSGCDKNEISFCEFKTIDSQDLIRVHDTVTKVRLPKDFKNRYEILRRKRNTIMHSVDKQMRVNAQDILISILDISDCLLQPRIWVSKREEYLEGTSLSVAGAEGNRDRLFEEIDKVIAILTPSQVTKYFNFNKNHRRYICLSCMSSSVGGERPNLVQLTPNAADSQIALCLLCREPQDVLRQKCKNPACKGNVIHKDEKRCLSCGHEQ